MENDSILQPEESQGIEMTAKPSREQIQELISYLPVFKQEGFEPIIKWRGGELRPNGAHTIPWPEYKEVVQEFFRLAGKDCWCDYEYTEKNVPALIEKPGFFEKASLEQCKTVLTFCVRGERFCDGHWGAMIKAGVVQRLLARLTVIRKEIG